MVPTDRQQQIAAVLARLRRLLEQRWPTSPQTLEPIEQTVEEVSQELERELEERILPQQEPSRENQARCPCGGVARYRRRRPRRLVTRHGERTLWRRDYHCATCRRGLVPLDRQLGLDRPVTTPTVRRWIARIAARDTFAGATATLPELTGVRLSASTVTDTAVQVGAALARAQQARGQEHQAGHPPAVQRRPRRLYVSLDGKLVPLRDAWKRDGSAGPLVCRYGECKLGAVYEAEAGNEGDAGVRWAAYTATWGDARAFAPLLSTLAHEHGHHFARELIVLGDGAAWIWQVAAGQFPFALQIVDDYHAREHLGTVAAARFGEGSAAAQEWVAAREAELHQDQVRAVLWAIAAWKPKSREGKKLRRREFGYFRQNAERMRYGTCRAKGYHIASGVVESGCGRVIGQRLDQAGMHWRPATAEAMSCLRAVVCSSDPIDLTSYCRGHA
jgi:uncharacterized protein UPF0236